MKPPIGAAPPAGSRVRITADMAGVESSPPVPHQTRVTPAAAAILMMIWMAVELKYRPSPETQSVPPLTATPSDTRASKTDCTKFCR